MGGDHNIIPFSPRQGPLRMSTCGFEGFERPGPIARAEAGTGAGREEGGTQAVQDVYGNSESTTVAAISNNIG